MRSSEQVLTAASTSRFVQTKKWKLHINEAGKGHPLIMLHGAGPGAGGWTNFSHNIGALSNKYRVILMDFPGFNKSDEFDPESGERHAANAEAVKLLMDELKIEKATLIGNSLGGFATLMFSSLYNDRIDRAILMGTPSPMIGPPHFYSPAGVSEGLKVLWETYADPSPENFLRLVNIMVYDGSFATKELAKERSDQAKLNLKHLSNWIKGLPLIAQATPEMKSLWEKLSQMQTPTLVIHGRDDRVVGVENGLRNAALIPNATLVVFNRCGHWAQIEHAGKFNALVDTFLRDAG
ncbi:MAG: alpha/beta fold hydrolase [Rhodospirillales bacterium]|nr:alpha/beta fold hydrolase [Rhodospirillales bacterium]